MAAADRYFDLYDMDTSLDEKSDPVRIKEFKNEITFENVVFAYSDNESKVLKDINFTLKKGNMVAVVGETGVW